MTLHATLSPSSAERWISCPASVRMAELVPDQQGESTYAREGTAAHALAELMARYHILGDMTGKLFESKLAWWRKEFGVSDDAEAEMTEHATAYVEYLRGRLEANPGSQLLLEQRLPTGIQDSWGTSDAVVVSPVAVESIDFKYGLGVRVEAVGNPQIRLYGVGALEAFGDLLGEVETVRLTIFQPRLDHVAMEELTAADLRAWRDSIVPVAQLALGPDAPFGPSEDACRWCPASGQCKAQMEWATQRDFGIKPDVMDADELAKALDDIPFILQWCAAVQDYALDRMYSKEQPIPGYKVVKSGGKRSITDPTAALQALLEVGFTEQQVTTTKIKGIGELEKLLRRGFDDVLGPYVKKGEGSPSLVRDDDKRPSTNPTASAVVDFGGTE